MMEHTPDLGSLIDEHVHGAEPVGFAQVHDLLVRAGPLPELPDALAWPPAVARPPRLTDTLRTGSQSNCTLGRQSEGRGRRVLGTTLL